MVSSFTPNKRLEQPPNGSYPNVWDGPVNDDFGFIDEAFGGTTNLNATSGSAVLSATQYRPLALSISGAISASVTYTIPSTVGGQWIVRNTTTDASGGPWTVTIASGGGGTSVIIPRNVTVTIFSDGTNIRAVNSLGAVNKIDGTTGAADIPAGTTAQRPTPELGYFRYNTSLSRFEGYNGTNWTSLDGASGGGNDSIFYENGQNVTTNYTIPANTNAMSAGPITIDSGVTVTVSSGSVWIIV